MLKPYIVTINGFDYSLQNIASAGKLGELNLVGVNFSGHDLSGIDFKGADLRCCNFSGCDLSSCNFAHCNLEDATFNFANTFHANFVAANMKFAKTKYANFTHADILSTSTLVCRPNLKSYAWYNEWDKNPNKYTAPECPNYTQLREEHKREVIRKKALIQLDILTIEQDIFILAVGPDSLSKYGKEQLSNSVANLRAKSTELIYQHNNLK